MIFVKDSLLDHNKNKYFFIIHQTRNQLVQLTPSSCSSDSMKHRTRQKGETDRSRPLFHCLCFHMSTTVNKHLTRLFHARCAVESLLPPLLVGSCEGEVK